VGSARGVSGCSSPEPAANPHIQDATPELAVPGTTWVKVSDYQDKSKLVEALKGVHTVLSFVVAHQDIGNATQTALIDAAIEAGVKRFAPSEWAM
jgi:hypothetical protein